MLNIYVDQNYLVVVFAKIIVKNEDYSLKTKITL